MSCYCIFAITTPTVSKMETVHLIPHFINMVILTHSDIEEA